MSLNQTSSISHDNMIITPKTKKHKYKSDKSSSKRYNPESDPEHESEVIHTIKASASEKQKLLPKITTSSLMSKLRFLEALLRSNQELNDDRIETLEQQVESLQIQLNHNQETVEEPMVSWSSSVNTSPITDELDSEWINDSSLDEVKDYITWCKTKLTGFKFNQVLINTIKKEYKLKRSETLIDSFDGLIFYDQSEIFSPKISTLRSHLDNDSDSFPVDFWIKNDKVPMNYKIESAVIDTGASLCVFNYPDLRVDETEYKVYGVDEHEMKCKKGQGIFIMKDLKPKLIIFYILKSHLLGMNFIRKHKLIIENEILTILDNG